jgi:methylated-DNA-protein-cysteine methyltransferase-like protein
MEELWQIVRQIPPGRCASYGDVGRALSSPVSGFLVGRMMARCPDDVPWWRVVARDGKLPVWKVDPSFENQQVARLVDEGVRVEDGRVDMAAHQWVP